MSEQDPNTIDLVLGAKGGSEMADHQLYERVMPRFLQWATGRLPGHLRGAEDTVDMAGAEWSYTIRVSKIPDMTMRRLDVDVAFADDPDETIATVIGFLPAPQSGGSNDTVRRFGEGWDPLDPDSILTQGAQQ